MTTLIISALILTLALGIYASFLHIKIDHLEMEKDYWRTEAMADQKKINELLAKEHYKKVFAQTAR